MHSFARGMAAGTFLLPINLTFFKMLAVFYNNDNYTALIML